MINIENIIVQVLIEKNKENQCAKCCKTIQVVERMMETISELKNNVIIAYKNISSEEIFEKYGELEVPVIIINDKIFSQGHVPIIKKLSRKLVELSRN
ncbi:MAG: thioredoxin family protein [Promethearchaeota archaeon]